MTYSRVDRTAGLTTGTAGLPDFWAVLASVTQWTVVYGFKCMNMFCFYAVMHKVIHKTQYPGKPLMVTNGLFSGREVLAYLYA